MCPDVPRMELGNYYGSLDGFSSAWYGLYYCDDAAAMLNYTDPNCETDHLVADSIMTNAFTLVLSKTVT